MTTLCRSGDQFCVYVADRFVLPTLDGESVRAIATGEDSFDRRVRDYIHRTLSYSFVETLDGAGAYVLEATVRSGALNDLPPHLNPMRQRLQGGVASSTVDGSRSS